MSASTAGMAPAAPAAAVIPSVVIVVFGWVRVIVVCLLMQSRRLMSLLWVQGRVPWFRGGRWWS